MKNVGNFLQEVKVELSKIVWPTRQEFIGATIVALVVILAFTLFLSLINYIFHVGINKILSALVFKIR
ncbi:MAG: preprotein translocase subunit SecE [Candidatus Chromulinivorax sp.]